MILKNHKAFERISYHELCLSCVESEIVYSSYIQCSVRYKDTKC